MGLSVVR